MEEKEKQIKKEEKKATVKSDKIKLKIIVLNVINVVLFLGLFFLLARVYQEASRTSELRSKSVAQQESADVAIIDAELDKSKDKINKVDSVFIDDEGFFAFLSEMERIRAETAVNDFSFPVSQPVLDSTKNPGLPVTIVFEGTQDEVNAAYDRVARLPYLLKPVNVVVEKLDEGRVIVRFGGFLYTNEEFNKN